MAKAEAEAAVNKICAALGSETSLLNLSIFLLEDNPNFIPSLTGMVAFLKDVNKNFGKDGLDGNLGLLGDLAWLKTWDVVYEALKPTDSHLRRDWETLSTVHSIRLNDVSSLIHLFAVINASTDAEIVNAKNGNFNLRLQTFLKRYSVADCWLCGNPSGYGIPTLKDVWANSKYMLGLYDAGLTDAQKLLNGGTFLSSVFSIKSGISHSHLPCCVTS